MEQTVARLDMEPNVPLEREVNRLPVVVLTLLPSNEAVHQTSTLARIATRAGSGATALLEAFFIFLFDLYFRDSKSNLCETGCRNERLVYALITLGILLY